MGRYDEQIQRSREMLDEARSKYEQALVNMADAAPHVRQYVLNVYQQEIDEAEGMIRTFESAKN